MSCFYLQEYETAKTHYEQASQLAKKHDFKSLEYKCSLELGKVLKETDLNEFKQHLGDLFDLAIQLEEEGTDANNFTRILLYLERFEFYLAASLLLDELGELALTTIHFPENLSHAHIHDQVDQLTAKFDQANETDVFTQQKTHFRAEIARLRHKIAQ
jgi:hypothetical protein